MKILAFMVLLLGILISLASYVVYQSSYTNKSALVFGLSLPVFLIFLSCYIFLLGKSSFFWFAWILLVYPVLLLLAWLSLYLLNIP